MKRVISIAVVSCAVAIFASPVFAEDCVNVTMNFKLTKNEYPVQYTPDMTLSYTKCDGTKGLYKTADKNANPYTDTGYSFAAKPGTEVNLILNYLATGSSFSTKKPMLTTKASSDKELSCDIWLKRKIEKAYPTYCSPPYVAVPLRITCKGGATVENTHFCTNNFKE